MTRITTDSASIVSVVQGFDLQSFDLKNFMIFQCTL